MEIEVEYINKKLEIAWAKDHYESLPRDPSCFQILLELVFVVFALSLVPSLLYSLEYSIDTNMDSYFGNYTQKNDTECIEDEKI